MEKYEDGTFSDRKTRRTYQPGSLGHQVLGNEYILALAAAGIPIWMIEIAG